MSETQAPAATIRLTLDRDVRTFRRSIPGGNQLCRTEYVMEEGDQLEYGTPQSMIYNHDDHTAAELVEYPGYFIIVKELTETPAVMQLRTPRPRIIVSKVSDCFVANLKGRPEINGSGTTYNEALGSMVHTHQTRLGLKIESGK